MNLINCMHTNSKCYKTNEKANQVGIVVHSTGANNKSLAKYVQPSADDVNYDSLIDKLGKNKYGNHWNRNVNKAVHYFIGTLADGEVATAWVLPENICAWGVGKGNKGSYNYNPTAHIQFEVCEDNLKDEVYFSKIYKEAVELCADICKRHGWDADVIVSHKECGAKGYGSNHKDIDHWLEKHGKTMNDFRAEVQKLLDEPKTITVYYVKSGPHEKKETAEDIIEKLATDGYEAEIIEVETEAPAPEPFKPYKVKVNTKAGVNIRTGPGTEYSKAGAIKNGTTVTIIEESEGTGANLWGLLSDGSGWISLDYCININ